MASLEEIRNNRLVKLSTLKEAGMPAYPSETNKTHIISDVILSFDNLLKVNSPIILAGRVLAMRGQGALLFIDINDGTKKFQAVLKQDEVNGKLFDLFKDAVDIGDFVEFSGDLFLTQKEQKSILVKDWKMLTKSLRPLPDKYSGFKDEDERFRKRYLDILFNPEVREMIEKKSLFWDVTRAFMKENGFFEVETPTLELTTGGAEAKPFQTHHNDSNMDLFLRISVGELWQKRLIVAGFPKTFEIGRIYRNEGSSASHLQEFTNMEFYWAYADYKDGMELTKKLYQRIAQDVFGKMQFKTGDYEYDLSGDWGTVDYTKEVIKQTSIDVLTATEDEMMDKLQELGVEYKGENKERLTDTLWKYCRKNIAGPVFLINHPKLVSPLAKETTHNENLTERFQVLIAGTEIGNGYSELNDPQEQAKRFGEQQKLIDRGDDEAMMPDDEFVEALEYGLPPTCGFGFGERLFALLMNKPVREGQTFPLMKPKKLDNENKDTE